MSWLAITKDGTESITAERPEYLISLDLWWTEKDHIQLPPQLYQKDIRQRNYPKRVPGRNLA